MAKRMIPEHKPKEEYEQQPIKRDFWCTLTRDMSEVVIPDGITEIPPGAFLGYYQLSSVHIPDSVTAIERGAFMDCKMLEEIHIPDSVKMIGSDWGQYLDCGAFSGCSSLKEITIPEGVEVINRGTFSGCTNLESVTLPDSLTYIGTRAFMQCEHLTSIRIPEGVTSIGTRAFMRCEHLTSIHIPEGVTSIGADAFAGCSRLTAVSIPDSVKYIGEGAFADTPWFDNDSHDWLIFGSVLLRYQGTEQEVVIPDTITSISAQAFKGCTALTSITIPDSVTAIGMGAFLGCRKLRSITIPDSVTDFEGYFTFKGCSGLTSVTIRNITLNKAALTHFRKQGGNDRLSEAIVLIANHYREYVFAVQPEVLADVLWTVFDLYPDDEETLACIRANFSRIFPFLLGTDNTGLLQKVLDHGDFIKRRNIDKYITHTIDKKHPRMQHMLETYKAEHLGKRKKRK